MKFISTPQNGMSWNGQLLYSFTTESSEPMDVPVKIYDFATRELIAEKMLYGVTEATIDIAPYVRSICNSTITPSYTHQLVASPTSKIVVVEVGKVLSACHLVAPEMLDISQPKMLSEISTEGEYRRSDSTYSYGDKILLSFFTPEKSVVEIVAYSLMGVRQHKLEWKGAPQPLDLTINTLMFPLSTSEIKVNIYSANKLIQGLNFKLTKDAQEGRRFCWRNALGGIESYLFPHSLRLVDAAKMREFQTLGGVVAQLVRAERRSRVSSFLDSSEELERLKGIMRAEHVYEMARTALSPIRLENRTIEYGTHGEIRQIVLEVCEEWKGGEL